MARASRSNRASASHRSVGAARVTAITASATKLRFRRKMAGPTSQMRPKEWQTECWDNFDVVPEIKRGVRFAGDQMAKIRVYAATRPPDADETVDPIPVHHPDAQLPPGLADAAVAELKRLRSPIGGRAEIQRALTMNHDVAGECYLIGRSEQTIVKDGETTTVPEAWNIRSIDEVKSEDDSVKVLEMNDVGGTEWVKLDDQKDTLIRIWLRHPRKSADPDSDLRGCLSDCRALQLLQQQIVAEAASRQSAGFFTLPNGLSLLTEPADDLDEDEDPVEHELERALIDPVENPQSAAAVAPVFIRGDPDSLKPDVLRHITLARTNDPALDQRVEARIERIARGMNLPVETIKGHQHTTYANAEQIGEDKWKDHFEPRANGMVDGLTVGFLTPQLVDYNQWTIEEIERVFLWYDPAELLPEPNPTSSADEGLKMFAISWEAWRREKGFSPEDAPSVEEVLAMAALQRGQISADMAVALFDLLGIPVDVTQGAGGQGATPAAAMRVAVEGLLGPRRALTAASRPSHGSPGWKLMALDRDLRSRLIVAADKTMARAIERATARLRTKISQQARHLQASIANVPNGALAAHLGPSIIADAGIPIDELLSDAFDELEPQFMAWGAAAQDEAISIVSKIVGGLDVAQRDTYKLRQAGDLTEAWGWLKDALMSLGHTRLFNPAPDAPEFGEIDSTSIPAGMIRQALARAGGAIDLEAAQGSVFLTLTQGGTRPAGGIGTGQLVGEALSQGGAQIEAYEWVYGPALRARPFAPHEELDGTTFVNFDDEALANRDSFPEVPFFIPGDHDGCICDVAPVIVGPSDLT